MSTRLNSTGSAFSRCLFLFFLAITFLSKDAYAGAWVQDPYNFMVMTSVGLFNSDKNYNRFGDEASNALRENPDLAFSPPRPANYKQYDGTLYMEYGLPYDLEIDISFPFYTRNTLSADFGSFSTEGISDMTVGLKALWFWREWFLSSILFEVGIPLGDDSAVGTSGTLAPQEMPIGDGEWDYAIRLIGSKGFQTLPIYLTGDIGYRFRNIARGSDDIPWTAEAGYSFYFPGKWFSFITPFINFSGMLSLGEVNDQDALVLVLSQTLTGASPNEEVIEFRPGVFVGIWDKLSFGVNYLQTLQGKNTGAGWGLRAGLMWQN